jgi:hypothetical protein
MAFEINVTASAAFKSTAKRMKPRKSAQREGFKSFDSVIGGFSTLKCITKVPRSRMQLKKMQIIQMSFQHFLSTC